MINRIYKMKEISMAICAVFILLAFAVTIIGVSLGLKNHYKDKYKVTEAQKLEDCKALSCKDDALINCKLISKIN